MLSRRLVANACLLSKNAGICLPSITRRSVITSTVDWKPIKTHKNPNEKKQQKGSMGKKIVLGLMFAMPVISFYLGTWQMRRLRWKTRLIATCESRLTYEPVPLPKNFTPDMCEDWEYRKVKLRGQFKHDEELFVGPRTRHGEKGYILFTPFIRRDTGEKLLIERGWIDEDKVVPQRRTLNHLSLPQGDNVEIVCFVRVARDRGTFQWAKEDPNSRLWQVADINEMAKSCGATPIYLQAVYDLRDHNEYIPKPKESSLWWRIWPSKSSNNPSAPVTEELEFTEWQLIKAGVPIGKQPKIDLRNNHLQYLVTWYGLSLLSTIFLVVALRKYRKGSVTTHDAATRAKQRHAQRFM